MFSSSVFWRKKRIIDPLIHPDSTWLTDIRTLLYVLSLERLIFLCGNQETKGLYQTINTKHNLHVRRLASLHFCLVPMNLCICIKRSGLWQPNNTTAHFSECPAFQKNSAVADKKLGSNKDHSFLAIWVVEMLFTAKVKYAFLKERKEENCNQKDKENWSSPA